MIACAEARNGYSFPAMTTHTLSLRAGLLAAALCLAATPALRAETEQKPEKPLSAAQKVFDKDADGKLNEEEAAAYKAARKAEKKAQLEKYDADKDGKLSEEEKAAMVADKKKAKKDHSAE